MDYGPLSRPADVRGQPTRLQRATVSVINDDGTVDVRLKQSRANRNHVPVFGQPPPLGAEVLLAELDGNPNTPIVLTAAAAGAGFTIDGIPTNTQILEYNGSTNTWQPVDRYQTIDLGTFTAIATHANVPTDGVYSFCSDGVSLLPDHSSIADTGPMPAFVSLLPLSGYDRRGGVFPDPVPGTFEQELHFNLSASAMVNDLTTLSPAVPSYIAVDFGVYTSGWTDPGSNGIRMDIGTRKALTTLNLNGIGGGGWSTANSGGGDVVFIGMEDFLPCVLFHDAMPVGAKALLSFTVLGRQLLDTHPLP